MKFNLEQINAIKDLLVEQHQTLAVAESVTSGYLQAAFSAATLASRYFQGGITAYNAGQKCRHLNIEPIHAMKDDCVSEVVARQMAVEVNTIFLSSYGIGITGYATKVPETGVNDLFAHFAIAKEKEIILVKKIGSEEKETWEVQMDYMTQVVQAFYDMLKNK